jgi:hypothetical protein
LGSLITHAENDREELNMTGTALLINIPLMVLFFALWVGIPLRMVLKGDTRPAPAGEPALIRLPERQREDADQRRAA